MAYDGRLKELKSALKNVLAENDQIVSHADANREEGGPEVQVEAKHVDAFRSNLTKAREIRAEIEALEGMREVREWAEAAETPSAAKSGLVLPGGAQYKTLGQQFIESDEFKALGGGRGGYTMNSPFMVKGDLGGYFQRKAVYTALPSGTPGDFGTPQREGIVERAKRSMRVRDLFDVQQTNTNMIEYFRVSGFTNNAATVSERSGSPENFTAKPNSTMSVVGVQAPVRTIAHYEVAHRNVLDDEPTLRGVIDSELLYGLRLVEDDQILNGDGLGSNLTGILATSGIQSHAWSAGSLDDTRIDAIRRGITKSLLAYYEPTGMIIHPNDLEDIELTKDGNLNYLMVMSVSVGAEARLWRLPIVETPAIAEGSVLLGSFGIGATLYDRMEGTIRVSEQHSDFFVRNAVAVLAEERIALAVKRPESFVEVTLDGAPEA
jgi:HK97 family phage major capsid protein